MFGIKKAINEAVSELRELINFDDKVINLLRRQVTLQEAIFDLLNEQTNLMQE